MNDMTSFRLQDTHVEAVTDEVALYLAQLCLEQSGIEDQLPAIIETINEHLCAIYEDQLVPRLGEHITNEPIKPTFRTPIYEQFSLLTQAEPGEMFNLDMLTDYQKGWMKKLSSDGELAIFTKLAPEQTEHEIGFVFNLPPQVCTRTSQTHTLLVVLNQVETDGEYEIKEAHFTDPMNIQEQWELFAEKLEDAA